ncbi:LysR family transcriptional regulator [Thiobacter aerophilum]|uniref:HTH-type transcriptional regulator MetR n=1 Tax=Thiobacter aerophilum TaxID=3121275 RepID=A0ABV0EFG4_9BURK
MIELRHLRALAALAETGSISAAAARLNLTQSALSHQIAALEAYLDLALLERGRRPLRLSPAGERLLALARRVLPEVDAVRQDLARLKAGGGTREMRIAVECHTCYDWLMPAMDAYRERHPEVEQDLVPGFHADPLALLSAHQADLVIVSEAPARRGIAYFPLFRYEMVALLARGHALLARSYLTARDFAGETLITYPVPDRMLDVVRRVLKPARVNPPRRTAELTVAILQLVASRRGIAVLPRWAVESYLERGYVLARPVGARGLWGRLFAAVRAREKTLYADFASLLADTARRGLRGITD